MAGRLNSELAGLKGTKLGPTVSTSDREEKHVLALKRRHPGWGYKTLHRETGLSVMVIRRILRPAVSK